MKMMGQDFYTSFGLTLTVLKFLIFLAPYWLPVLLGLTFWRLWMLYVQLQHMAGIKWVLLGIRLPKNIMKTPLSMELVLSAMHQTSEGNWYEKIWKGKLKPYFSLEMASIGGDIHFFIRTSAPFKNFIEAQLYSQFQGIEIYEAEDYTEMLEYKPGDEWEMWGTEFTLTKADPYPIKTYIDYKLDQQIKKEEEISSRTDPLSPAIEFMGSIGKNEQIWVQFLVRATGKRFRTPGKWFEKRDWKSEAKDLVKTIQAKAGESKLSRSDAEAVSAIEREITKFGFDVGVRAIYLGREGAWTPMNIPGVVGMMKHYNSENLNGFKPKNATGVDYPWQGILWNKVDDQKKNMFRAYRARGFFYEPFKKKPFVLNTEELATVYHFPSGMSETPGFTTISSHKAEPPANLPI